MTRSELEPFSGTYCEIILDDDDVLLGKFKLLSELFVKSCKIWAADCQITLNEIEYPPEHYTALVCYHSEIKSIRSIKQEN